MKNDKSAGIAYQNIRHLMRDVGSDVTSTEEKVGYLKLIIIDAS